MLEHKGARAGMLTNEGFRDIIHIARHQRAEHYSIMQELPWQNRPLVKRRHRKVVKGRLVPPRGEELEPLDEAGVIAAARALKAEAVEAVAVCFLFSYLNPAHEERAKAILERELPGVFVVTSSSISPQFREYERFTTACLCAFIGPKMRGYVGRLEAALRDAGLPLGIARHGIERRRRDPAMVSEKPAMTLLSGLAAGVLGGAWIGGLSGRRKLVTFDIGGTSADIGIVVEGRFAETDARSTSIAGFPLLLPMIDIHTIGAGGGSIAYIDHGGAFRVGPRSAGAVPGPAAYGRGGTRADRDRRQPRPRPARQERFPRRQHAARRGRRASRHRGARRRARHEQARRGRRRAHRHQQQHGERHPLAHGAEGHRPPRVRACRLRRRRAAARRSKSPPCSASRK